MKDLSKVYEHELESLAANLAARLKQEEWTIALAESLTGGMATSRLVNIPGISNNLRGSVVAYSDRVKSQLLGVDFELLPPGKAVSFECAEAMLIGLARLMPTDLSLSFTGNAGPSPSCGQPVGLVFIGLGLGSRHEIRSFNFQGSRQEIRLQSVIAGYRLALEFLEMVE